MAETSAGAETGAGNKAPNKQLMLLNFEALPANAHQITLTKVTSVANGNEVLVGLMLARAYTAHAMTSAEPNGVQRAAAAAPTREPTTINVSDSGAISWNNWARRTPVTRADTPRTAAEGSQGKRIESGRCLTSQVSVSSSSDCSTRDLRLFSPCFSLPRGVTISCANSKTLPCLIDGSGESACVKAASTAKGTSGSSLSRGIFGPL